MDLTAPFPLQVGQKKGNCDVVQFLGAGSFGKVFRVVCQPSNFQFACKVLNLNGLQHSQREATRREVNIHKQLKHVNVISFYQEGCENDFIFVGLELAESCLYDQVRKGLSAAICHRYFCELISGVEYLHSMCVAHRDIKTKNLLIGRDGRLKIADFGLATQVDRLSEAKANTMRGTYQYTAPEVFSEEPYHLQPADIWSCGIVLFEMLTARIPWPFAASTCPEYCQFREQYLSLGSLYWMRRVTGDIKSHPIGRYRVDLISITEVSRLLKQVLHESPSCRAKIEDIKASHYFSRV